MSQSPLPRLVLTGPESTGKSALAKALVENLDGVLVEEYLRDYFALQGSLDLEDAIPVAQGQWGREEQAAAEAARQGKLLVCDTDLISSLVYNTHYYADEMNTPQWALWEQWSERHRKRLHRAPFSPRLYILCGIDWTWVPDGQRDAPQMRERFHRRFTAELEQHGCHWIGVTGSLDERLSTVLAHLVKLHVGRD